LIFDELKIRYPSVTISKNVKLTGRITKKKRQIDVLIETQVLDSRIRIIVDAKRRKHPIDINDVESFIAMMSDVEAHRGILISSAGYTSAAVARAHNEPNQDIELEIFSISELKAYQGELGIPYSGDCGIILDAPFGWVVDGQKQSHWAACLYQRGLTVDEAIKANEWMYLNFWKRKLTGHTLRDLIMIQEEEFHQHLDAHQISYQTGVDRSDAASIIRLVEIPGNKIVEYTGFVEFEEFIIFFVLLTTPEMSKRNLKKLREIMRTVKPIHVKHN
jgi:hypothetical protein